MKIGLIDVDGHNGHPNLALMKLSAFHKAQGDTVDWWNGFEEYDCVYMSKVFTFSPDMDTVIRAKKIIRGGTGYRDYGSLPPEVEAIYPDYSIYPNYKAAIGFLTRGCIRNCPWCIVPRKEGAIRPAATWQEIKRHDSRDIVFLDNNLSDIFERYREWVLENTEESEKYERGEFTHALEVEEDGSWTRYICKLADHVLENKSYYKEKPDVEIHLTKYGDEKASHISMLFLNGHYMKDSFKVGPISTFEAFILNLYYNETKIILDEDDVDENPYFDVDI